MIEPTFRVLAVTVLNATLGPRTNDAPTIVLAVRVPPTLTSVFAVNIPGTYKSPFVLVK